MSSKSTPAHANSSVITPRNAPDATAEAPEEGDPEGDLFFFLSSWGRRETPSRKKEMI